MTDDLMRRGALFIREAAIDWDVVPRGSYLRDIPALKGFDRLAFESNVTFFAGENGTGKSTLLEGIAVAYGFNPEGGTQNYHFSTYHDVSELEEAIRLVRGYRQRNSGYFFRAESFFNVATAMPSSSVDLPVPFSPAKKVTLLSKTSRSNPFRAGMLRR